MSEDIVLMAEDAKSAAQPTAEQTRLIEDAQPIDDVNVSTDRSALDRQLRVLSHAAAILRNLRMKRNGEIPQ